MKIKLKALNTSLKGVVWEFDSITKVTIGRSSSCDISAPLDNPFINRIASYSTAIYVSEDKVYLSDMDSAHGTYLNSERIKVNCSKGMNIDDLANDWVELKDKDIIGLGGNGLDFILVVDIPKVAKKPSIEEIRTEKFELLKQYITKRLNMWKPNDEFATRVTIKSDQGFKQNYQNDFMDSINDNKHDQYDVVDDLEELEEVEEKPKQEAINEPLKMIKEIGAGGFGKVYLLEGVNSKKKYVSKDIIINNKEFNFFHANREQRFLRSLNHPNVLKGYEAMWFNHKDEVIDPFTSAESIKKMRIIMEYCDGGDVSDKVKNSGRLSIEEATRIILEAIDGLIYLHNVKMVEKDKYGNEMEVKGVVHRDIKPANLLFKHENGKEVVKIADLGLAKAYEMAGLTDETATLGACYSLYFASRNQVNLNGGFKYAKPQVDIYAMMATYYFMLTGRDARGCAHLSDKEYVEMIYRGILKPIEQVNKNIPMPLAKVINDVLAEDNITDANYHFTTAKELKEKLIKAYEESMK